MPGAAEGQRGAAWAGRSEGGKHRPEVRGTATAVHHQPARPRKKKEHLGAPKCSGYRYGLSTAKAVLLGAMNVVNFAQGVECSQCRTRVRHVCRVRGPERTPADLVTAGWLQFGQISRYARRRVRGEPVAFVMPRTGTCAGGDLRWLNAYSWDDLPALLTEHIVEAAHVHLRQEDVPRNHMFQRYERLNHNTVGLTTQAGVRISISYRQIKFLREQFSFADLRDARNVSCAAHFVVYKRQENQTPLWSACVCACVCVCV